MKKTAYITVCNIQNRWAIGKNSSYLYPLCKTLINAGICDVIIGKGVLFKTFDVKVQVQNVPELWRQRFEKWLFLNGASHMFSIWYLRQRY